MDEFINESKKKKKSRKKHINTDVRKYVMGSFGGYSGVGLGHDSSCGDGGDGGGGGE